MTPGEAGSNRTDPRGDVSDVVLQRGAFGRWALVDGEGAKIEADAESFVEIEP